MSSLKYYVSVMVIIRNLFGESVWQSLIVGRQVSGVDSSFSLVGGADAPRPAVGAVPAGSPGEAGGWCAGCPVVGMCSNDECGWVSFDVDFPIPFHHYSNLGEFINDIKRQGWL